MATPKEMETELAALRKQLEAERGLTDQTTKEWQAQVETMTAELAAFQKAAQEREAALKAACPPAESPIDRYQEQIAALALLVEPRFVKQDKNVKGNFTSGDYVEFQLREIFGPANINIEIKSGPELVNISERESYTRIVIRLWVTFANGQQAYQDSIGVWPLKATRAAEGGTLEETAAERYETALKASMTDAIKGAAERLGNCFRPTMDATVTSLISEREYKRKHPKALTPEGQAATKNALYEGENQAASAPSGNGQEFNEKAASATVRVKQAFKEFRSACKELVTQHPDYQTQVKGKPSGEPNMFHILGAAGKLGFTEINDGNYQAVIEAIARRAVAQAAPPEEIPF